LLSGIGSLSLGILSVWILPAVGRHRYQAAPALAASDTVA
jgi:hypothetical protein